jgi:integrase/recombinase XerD
MNRVLPSSIDYQKNLMGFENVIESLNYNGMTIRNAVNGMSEFFVHLEENGITITKKITPKDVMGFFDYLKNRVNIRKGEGFIKNNTINKYINAIKMFNRDYAIPSHLPVIPVFMKYLKYDRTEPDIMTTTEVRWMFQAAESHFDKVDRMEDLTILGILYGAGLRRTEVVKLDVDDIMIHDCMIHVREGKKYKERYIPVTREIINYINDYINYCREDLLADINDTALFVSRGGKDWGKRLSGQGIYCRMKSLARVAGVDKLIYPHLFRHSIGTHLYMNGMDLFDVKKFLGHYCLESTQKYVHYAYKLKQIEENGTT